MAGKVSKNKRIGVITKILTENPNHVFTLNYFTEIFNCAKSTLSEDIDVIEEYFNEFKMGKIESIAGAAGGIIYKPVLTNNQVREIAEELCNKIKEDNRIIPGGYVYMNDIFYNPNMVYKIGRALANPYMDKEVDYVVTIETKGIPIALATAQVLNKPMLVVRKSTKMTEGTTIQMNLITGSSKNIKTMSLAKRSLPRGSKVLFIDDFMKAGGTAKGIVDLMQEFEAEVIGIGVVMATTTPEKKVIKKYDYLVEIVNILEEENQIDVRVRE